MSIKNPKDDYQAMPSAPWPFAIRFVQLFILILFCLIFDFVRSSPKISLYFSGSFINKNQ